MTVYVLITVYNGVVDSVECYLNEEEAEKAYKQKKEENKDDLKIDVSLHTCL